jgi:hypothetical protein
MPGLGFLGRFQVNGRGIATGSKFMTSGPLNTSSRVRGITSFAASYGVLLLSDGDIRHKNPALVSVLSSGRDLIPKEARLHPPDLRATFSPARVQVIYFQGIRSAQNRKEQAQFTPGNNVADSASVRGDVSPFLLRYVRTHHTRFHNDDPGRT